MSHFCQGCGKGEAQCSTPFQQCSRCKVVRYCSKVCQRRHCGEHKDLCQAIVHLTERTKGTRGEEGIYPSHLPPREHATIVQLVGRKFIVHCELNGQAAEALLVTGAQVSIISWDWVQSNLPECEVKPVQELLGVSGLDLMAAYGTDLPYMGWIDIDFKLTGRDHDYGIKVPFLVSKGHLDAPIIGYNVIEEITRNSEQSTTGRKQPFVDVMSASLVDVINTERSEDLSPVKTSKRDIFIPGVRWSILLVM